MGENQSFLAAAVEAVRAAGRIQLRNLGRHHRIRTKSGPTDLVTEVDLRCEERIREILRSRFPGHAVHAEEGGSSGNGAAYRWFVDPLDGTTNYAHGYPCFCASVALAVRGRVVVAAVYDPVRRELFTAERGGGARLNGRPIRVSTTPRLDQALLATGFSYHVKETRQNLRLFRRFVLSARAVRRDGSAALDLCFTAMGRFDGFWEFSLKPWDVAAGSLILTEAGGRITLARGGRFSIHKGEVVASNRRIHRAMLEVIAAGAA